MGSFVLCGFCFVLFWFVLVLFVCFCVIVSFRFAPFGFGFCNMFVSVVLFLAFVRCVFLFNGL